MPRRPVFEPVVDRGKKTVGEKECPANLADFAHLDPAAQNARHAYAVQINEFANS